MKQSSIAVTPGFVLLIMLGCGGNVLDSDAGTLAQGAGSGGNLTADRTMTMGGTTSIRLTPIGGAASTPVTASTGGRLTTTFASGGTMAAGVGGGQVTLLVNCKVPTAATGAFTIANGNYFKVGNYAGYGFVFISPYGGTPLICPNSSFGSSTSALCAAGVVPTDETYNTAGGFGFNLNQPTAGGDPAPSIVTPAIVSRVVVTFVNTANTDLHIQIVQLSGTTQTDYCYEAKGAVSPLTLDASDFNTMCWTTGGALWDGTGAESFQFIIPSEATANVPFDACIQSVTFL